MLDIQQVQFFSIFARKFFTLGWICWISACCVVFKGAGAVLGGERKEGGPRDKLQRTPLVEVQFFLGLVPMPHIALWVGSSMWKEKNIFEHDNATAIHN